VRRVALALPALGPRLEDGIAEMSGVVVAVPVTCERAERECGCDCRRRQAKPGAQQRTPGDRSGGDAASELVYEIVDCHGLPRDRTPRRCFGQKVSGTTRRDAQLLRRAVA
jgi:hypothetical protein